MQHQRNINRSASVSAGYSDLKQHSPRLKRGLIISALSIAFGSGAFLPDSSFAAENYSVSDLQAENARLKQELEALKKGLQNNNEASSPASNSSANEVAAEKTAKPDVVDNSASDVLGAVVVTSRNKEEVAQDVPVPISVVSGKKLDDYNVVTVNELVKLAPNIGVFGSNPRQTSISIRGIGKNSAQDTLEPSVGVIVDGVVNSYVGQSWSDYVDLDRIEVVRGPQGTLLGKNTTLGAINISTKLPSFTPGYTVEGRVGEYNELVGKFSATGPVVDNLLAYRASFSLNKKDGALENLFQSNGTSGNETWNETNRIGGRIQFLLTPADNLSARFILDQTQTTENSNKSLLLSNGPANFSDGAPRTSSFATRLSRSYFNNSDGTPYKPVFGNNNIEDSQARPQRTKQGGVSAEVKWDINDNYTLTSITAHRGQDFDIKNGGVTKFDIGNGGQQLSNHQTSQEFRLNYNGSKKFDYQAGLFALASEVYSDDPTSYGADAGAFNASDKQWTALSDPKYRGLLTDSQRGVYRSYVLNPKTESVAAFGQINWHFTDDATLTLGLRNTQEHKSGRNKRELDRAGVGLTDATGLDDSKAVNYGLNLANASDLKAWNAAKALYLKAIGTDVAGAGGIYDWVNGKSINDNSWAWLINPSYKLNDNTLLYASVSQGEKSGAVEFNNDASSVNYGKPLNVKSEKARDYELGFKSLFFNKKFLLNANLYRTEITNYQGVLSESYLDNNNDVAIRSYLGNIPGVTAQGVEIETAFAVTPNFRLNLNGAYNDAEYTDFTTTAPDVSTPTLVNLKGKQLHGAPKVTLNYGFDYTKPIGSGFAAKFFLNNSYRSGAYLASNQSENTWQGSYTLTDAGVGVQKENGKYELSLVARNLFDKDYATGKGTYGNSGAITEQPGYGRSVGIVFRAKM